MCAQSGRAFVRPEWSGLCAPKVGRPLRLNGCGPPRLNACGPLRLNGCGPLRLNVADVLSCLPMRYGQCAHKDKTVSEIVVKPTRQGQCTLPTSDLPDSLIWVHAEARVRMLHRARVGPSGAASSAISTMRTMCGRTLADCTVGYGSPPSDRVWCHDCTPASVV